MAAGEKPTRSVKPRRFVREWIDPRLTASLFANYRSAIEALQELVDNAIDARIPGQALQLDLAIRPGSLTLTAVGVPEFERRVNELILVSLALTERRRRPRRGRPTGQSRGGWAPG